jgi:AcrR family transcriptional regulator
VNERSFYFDVGKQGTMPKVSQEHLDARRAHILDAARECFAARGFHATSMRDVCAQAGISAGSLYRYFDGKADIVGAICAEGREESVDIVIAALSAGGTVEAFDQLLVTYFESPDAKILQERRLFPQLWAEAHSDDDIATVLAEGMAQLRTTFAALVAGAQERGEIAAELDPESIASVMLGLFQGFLVQKGVDDSLPVRTYTDTVRALFGGTFWTGSEPGSATSVSTPTPHPSQEQ